MYRGFDRRKARARRHVRVRKRISGVPERPRLAVFRSLHHIYAQVIDDAMGRTLVAASSTEPEVRKALKSTASAQAAAAIGKTIAERARKHGVETVIFDRGGYPYQGRIKAVAEAARTGGLKF